MAKSRKYSELLPSVVHERLLGSADLRSERQQSKREQLPLAIGGAILGKKRPEEAVNPFFYRIIPKDTILALGRRLSRGGIITDQMNTRDVPLHDTEWYKNYVMKPNKVNKRPTPNSEDLVAKRQAKQRQTPNTADELHKYVWVQLQLAKLFDASLQNTRTSRIHTTSLNETAALFSASAVEDFGHCLTGKEVVRRLPGGMHLAKDLRQIGLRGSAEPETLMAQHDTLFLLVQREQERRKEHWRGLLEFYEEQGGNRRDAQDRADEAWVDDFVADMAVSAGSSHVS